MGLFGSSTETYYSSTSCKLYEEVPSVVKQTVVGAITQNRNIATDLVANLANGTAFKTTQLYNWAKDNYFWGLPDGSVDIVPPQAQEYVKQVLLGMHNNSAVHINYVVIEPDAVTNNLTYRVEYLVKGVDGPQMWTYDSTLGTYPILNIEEKDRQPISPYFPIIPIMQDGKYMAPNGGQHRADIVRALRYLNLDPDDIHDAIEADPDNPNPVEDAFVMLGVEIANNTELAAEYFHRFFSHMRGLSNVQEEDYTYWQGNQNTATPPINRIRIGDGNYRMELGWLFIKSSIKPGKLLTGLNYEVSTELAGPEPSIAGTPYRYSQDSLFIRKRLDDGHYQELQVVGLVHSNWAVGKTLRTTMAAAIQGDADEGVKQAFIIPLRKDILRQMGPLKTHDLVHSAIRLVVNDKFVRKLKWYETGIFEVFITIVAIVVTVFYPPLGVALTGAALLGFAMLYVFAMKLLAPILIKALEDILGKELALLVSVLAIAVGATVDFSSLSVSFTGVTAQSVAAAGLVGVSGAYGLQIADAMADINKELDVLQEDIEEFEKEEAERQRNIVMVRNAFRGDPYGILDPETHVKRFHMEAKRANLITNTVHQYVDVMRFVDRPDSYIRLGHTGV